MNVKKTRYILKNAKTFAETKNEILFSEFFSQSKMILNDYCFRLFMIYCLMIKPQKYRIMFQFVSYRISCQKI